jgi:hypothetical protein
MASRGESDVRKTGPRTVGTSCLLLQAICYLFMSYYTTAFSGTADAGSKYISRRIPSRASDARALAATLEISARPPTRYSL